MHTAMVPQQVKTMKIQAGIQVLRTREPKRQLQLWKCFGRLYLIVFVLVRNIVKEEADELYRDVDINQGRGLQVSQNVEDSHMTLTPVQPDGQQESSSVSSFMTSMLNSISDAGVESIFTIASSPIATIQTSTPIMTPSTIAIITTLSEAPIPPTTIPSATNQFAEAFSKISGIIHQYIIQQMMEAIRDAVQIQTDRL
nr:hypothetical protein [Tanacetum cinerariifolium]